MSIKQSPSVAKTAARPQRGRVVATPYVHGKGWAMRRRYKGHDLFVSGHKTAAAAQREMNQLVHQVDHHAKPAGAGASKTTLAQAMQDYAMERLPHLKGAPQEARRINVYLRAAGLRLLEVTELKQVADAPGKAGLGAYYRVELVPHTSERVIPNGLHQHRKAQLSANAGTDRRRAALASTYMVDIRRAQVQKLVNRMKIEKHSASTISLERSLLRVVFYHAFAVWGWSELQDNPATQLKMPKVDNERSRVLTHDEQKLLDAALHDCRNGMVAPTMTLLRETAMRASEPLANATWGDVDWERRVIKLRDAKGGKRDVPLSPAAIEALKALQPGADHEPVVRISYESMRAAWRRACERAGIRDLKIHDLRHTAATRMALKTGNVFLVKALTGHKTMEMLARYVNVSADDVVDVMHGKEAQAAEGAESNASTKTPVETPAPAPAAVPSSSPVVEFQPQETASSNVYQFPMRRRA